MQHGDSDPVLLWQKCLFRKVVKKVGKRMLDWRLQTISVRTNGATDSPEIVRGIFLYL